MIHTVGPVWSADEDRSATLRACYTNSLKVADDLGAVSVAFPLISSGVYRWPVRDAVVQAILHCHGSDRSPIRIDEAGTKVERVTLVLFDDATRDVAEAAVSDARNR